MIWSVLYYKSVWVKITKIKTVNKYQVEEGWFKILVNEIGQKALRKEYISRSILENILREQKWYVLKCIILKMFQGDNYECNGVLSYAGVDKIV